MKRHPPTAWVPGFGLPRPLSLLTLFALVLFVPALLSFSGAQGGLFSVQCEADGMAFFHQGEFLRRVSFREVAPPLTIARYVQINQPIVIMGDFGIWALASNELQVHRNENPDATKSIFPADICGTISSEPLSGLPTVDLDTAYVAVESQEGGAAAAVAMVLPTGEVITMAFAFGPARAEAYAQSISVQPGTAPTGSGSYYVVQPQDNLFRIALEHGVDLETLAAINGITNPALIYVGQVIYLP